MNPELIEQTVRDYSGKLLKIAYTYTKNTCDAEDIVQEVFLSFITSRQEFASQEHIRAWLIRVTINKSKNHVKSAWIAKRSKMPEPCEELSCQENTLLDAVLSLEEKYRISIHLFYYEDYSIKEIAQILGKKPATIGSWLDRGRKKLRKQLGGEFFEA